MSASLACSRRVRIVETVIVYILQRLLYAFLILLGVVTVLFLALRVIPGDPAVLLVGVNGTEEDFARVRERMGLNDPLYVQYFSYITQIFTLQFGESFRLPGGAMENVLRHLPNTLRLGAAALAIAVIVSLPLGMIAGARRGGRLDRFISTSSLFGQALPNFWVAIVLSLILARWFPIFPVGGDDEWSSIVLPAVTLALPMIGVLTRLARAGIIDELGQGYVMTARAKGISESEILARHAGRNMMIPIVTVVGLQVGDLIGGAVIVEVVFSWPGVGRLLLSSLNDRDYAVVQASVIVMAVAVLLANIIVDVAYSYLDPRIRTGRDK